MAKDPTQEEAARLLATAASLGRQVSRRAARESRVFLGWAVFLLVMLPPFDVVDGNVWGPIFSVAAIASWIATTRYSRHRDESVKILAAGQWSLTWVPWGLWYGGLVVAAELLNNQVGFIWTLAAIGGALPLFAVGAHLARAGR